MILNNKFSEQDEYTIIQFSDTHLLNETSSAFIGVNPEDCFHHVMTYIQENHPHIDAFVHTGDVAQEASPETYARYLNYMENIGIPFFQTPGNHDNEDFFPFHGQDPQQPFVIELNQWKIILLNSAIKGKTDGYIEHEQIESLIQILKQNPDQSVILACHHHPFDMNSAWLDQHKLKNPQELFSVLADFKQIKAVVYGHVHQSAQQYWHDVACLATPSTCIQFKPHSQDFALDEIEPGYRVIKLKANGTFESEIHRVKNFIPKINTEISGY